MADRNLSIPAVGHEPNLDLFVIDGALWILVGSHYRRLDADQTTQVAQFVSNASDALLDTL